MSECPEHTGRYEEFAGCFQCLSHYWQDENGKKVTRIEKLEADIKQLHEALAQTHQRLNESSTGTIGLIDTIHYAARMS